MLGAIIEVSLTAPVKLFENYVGSSRIKAVLSFEMDKTSGNNRSTTTSQKIFGLYHGHEPNVNKFDVHAHSEQHMQKFMKANGAAIAASGHILGRPILQFT